jgi:hypothetical protein
MLRLELWKDNLGSDNGFDTGVSEMLLSLNIKNCRCAFVSPRLVWIRIFFY